MAYVAKIPGLDTELVYDDLDKAQKIYNALPSYRGLPLERGQIPQRILLELGSVFVRNEVDHIFGLHLLHRHTSLADGFIMFGRAFSNPDGYWNQPHDMTGLWRIARGHAFKLTHGGTFVAYDFVEGAPYYTMRDFSAFLMELGGCLLRHNLQDVFGFELVRDGESHLVYEYDVEEGGTISLQDANALPEFSCRRTGWFFERGAVLNAVRVRTPNRGVPTLALRDHTGSEPVLDMGSIRRVLRLEGIPE